MVMDGERGGSTELSLPGRMFGEMRSPALSLRAAFAVVSVEGVVLRSLFTGEMSDGGGRAERPNRSLHLRAQPLEDVGFYSFKAGGRRRAGADL